MARSSGALNPRAPATNSVTPVFRRSAADRLNRWMREERALLARYKSTPMICGDVVVMLPQDAPALYAFDRFSGNRLWESEAAGVEAFALAGASGNMAIACGTALSG